MILAAFIFAAFSLLGMFCAFHVGHRRGQDVGRRIERMGQGHFY
jgi:hypothetical protein